MADNYLTEAFKALGALKEEAFDTSAEGLAKLDTFFDGDEIESIDIIDTEAEYEGELEDSYVGKVILKCPVCTSLIYEDADKIVIDEDSEMVNVSEECPYCHVIDGFTIVGQVAEYGKAKEEPEVTEPEVEETVETETAIEECDRPRGGIDKALTEDVGDDSIGIIYDEVLKCFDTHNIDVEDEDVKAYAKAAAEYIEFSRAQTDDLKDYSVDEWYAETKVNYPEDLAALKKLEECSTLKESVQDVVINTANQEVVVSDGITTIIDKETAAEGEEEIAPAEEVIEPVTSETATDIVDAQEEDTVDIDITDFDEETFDQVNEKYLTNVYENVSGYKTTKGTIEGNKLILEGEITFKSGVKSPTKYVFEGKDITKTGKARFVGNNKHLCKGNKPFTIRGKIEEAKFITESFAYNYKGTCAKSGKTEHCYGTIRV